MKAPTCSVCGHAHYAYQPHVIGDPKVSAPAKKRARPVIDALDQYLADEKARKAAYMRDYRARKKTAQAQA
jgi:hypothetical protein